MNKKSKITIISIIFLISISIISLAAINSQKAIEENVIISYKYNNMTIEFKEGINTIGQATLKSHKTYDEVLEVTSGRNVTVIWYEFSNFKDIQSNAFGEVEFIDMRKEIINESLLKEGGFLDESKMIIPNPNYLKPIEKNYTFVYLRDKEWVPYNSKDIPKENIIIGVQTDLGWGEFLDIRLNIMGSKLDRHALVLGTNCGFVTTAPTADPEGSSGAVETRISVNRHQAPGTGIVTEIGFYLNNEHSSGDVELGIYTDNDGEPGNLIEKVTGISQGTTAGWYKASTFSTEIVSGTYYWIGWAALNVEVAPYMDGVIVAEEINRYLRFTYSLPYTWDTGTDTNLAFLYAIYAVWEAAAEDTTYPTFSNYWDNNGSLSGSGAGLFNVTVTSTNGTVILHINGTDILATNLSANVYNASHTFTQAGTYLYNWTAYGNGTDRLLNTSINRYYTVNESADTSYPLFTNSGYNLTNNSEYSPNLNIKFNVTIANTNGTAGIEFNGTNYTLSNSSSEFYATITRGAGTYSYYYWAYGNGTNHLFNNSQTYYYTIAQNSSYNLSITGVTPITYGSQAGISNSSCPSQITCNLYRNNTGLITSPDNSILSAGSYNYTFNTTGNANYTARSTSFILVVNKAIPQGTLTNRTALTLEYPNPFNWTYSESNTGDSDVSYVIYRDGTDVTSENGINKILAVGTYNYVLNTTGGTNYTANSSMSSFTVTINQNTTYVLGITKTSPITYGTSTNFAGTGCPAQLTCSLNLTNGVFGAGVVYANYSTAGNANYSSKSVVDSVTINQASSSVGLTATTPITYGTTTNFAGSNCPSGATCSLNISNAVYPAGTISANYSFAGNTNYTGSSAVFTVTINKASSQTSLTFDKTTPQIYGTAITPTCSVITGVGTAVLKMDGNIITSGNPLTLGVNTYSFNCSLDSTTNYTASSNTSSFVINKANPSTLMTISGTTPIIYPTTSDFSPSETNTGDSGCSYSMDRSNGIYGVGTWTFNYSTAGCTNYSAGSVTKDLAVNQNTTYVLGLTATTPIEYPNPTDFTGSGCPSQLSCTLNLTNGVFQAGVINGNYSSNGNENYSANSEVFAVTINKNSTLVLTQTYTSPITYGTATDFIGVGCPTELTCSLNLTNGVFGAGTINSNYSTNGNTNYSATSNISSILINKAVLTGDLINNTDITFEYPNPFNFTISESNNGDLDVTYLVYRDGIDVTDENSTNKIIGVGTYDYILNSTGGANYSANASIEEFTLTITQNNTYVLSLAITPSTTETYPTETTATGTGCPSEIVCNLTINTSGIVDNPHVKTLGVGNYNYTYNTTGNANYSIKSDSDILTITQNTSAVIYTYLNNSRANITIYNNTAIWLNATLFNVSGTINLYKNGTLINSGNSPLSNLTAFNGTGEYNITAIYSGNENYSGAYETWFVNVTESLDTTPPYFTTIPSDISESYPYNLGVLFQATDETAFGYYSINWTDTFSINQSGYLNNTISLEVGNYYINVSINDTSGNLNSTIFNLNVTQNNTYVLSITGTTPIEYPQVTDVAGGNCPSELSCSLDKSNIVYGVGTETFNYSTTGNTNYSSNSITKDIVITQNNSYVLSLAITPSSTETYPTETTATGSGCPSQIVCNLTINISGIVDNPHIKTLGVGNYNYTFNTTGNANYSIKSDSDILTITQNTSSVVYTYLNNSRANITIYNNTAIWLNATLFNITGTISLYNNGTLISSGTTSRANYTAFNGTGEYNITAIYSGNENYSGAYETWFVNVTESLDTTPPYFTTIPSDISESYPYNLGVLFQATDETAFGYYSINWTDTFSINQSGYLNNTISLEVGNYYINVSINDTSGNLNSTIFNLNVTQNNTYVLSITGTTPINYGTASNFQGTNCPSQLTCNLSRNDTGIIDNPDTSVLATGKYNYTFNTSGNTNYSVKSASSVLTVNKNAGNCQVLFNETSPLDYLNKFNAYTNCNSDFTLRRNGTIISNNSVQSLGAGIWNFTVFRNDTENYTNIVDEEYFTINKIASSVYMYLNNSRDNLTIINSTIININATRITGEGDIIIYQDGNIFNSGASPLFNSTNFTTAETIHNFTAFYQATENYTSSFETFFLNVTSEAPVDTTNPSISLLTEFPAESVFNDYDHSQYYEFNATISDAHLQTVKFEFNGTNYTVSNLSSVYNKTFPSLSAGFYEYTWYANDSVGNKNITTGNYTIYKATSSGTITWTNNIIYGTIGDAEGTNTDLGNADVYYNLYRNFTGGTSNFILVSNPDLTILGAGMYDYLYEISGGQNYSQGNLTMGSLTVLQANSEVNLTINNSEGNKTIEIGSLIDINCTRITGEGIISLFNETVLMNSGNSPIGNTTTFNSLGFFNITCTYPSTNNYSFSYETYWVNVTDTVYPLINITYPLNTSYISAPTELNYTISEANTDTCWWTNNSGVINYTITCGNNVSGMNTTEGNNKWTVYINDTSNHINSSSVSFYLDTTKPSFSNLRNFTISVNTSFSQSITATDVSGIGSYWLNDTDYFIINISTGLITNKTNLSRIEIHYLNISVNDTLGNLNSGIFWVNITSTTLKESGYIGLAYWETYNMNINNETYPPKTVIFNNTGDSQGNISFINVTNGLFFYDNYSILGNSNILLNNGSINISVFNYSNLTFINDINLSEGGNIFRSPFSILSKSVVSNVITYSIQNNLSQINNLTFYPYSNIPCPNTISILSNGSTSEKSLSFSCSALSLVTNITINSLNNSINLIYLRYDTGPGSGGRGSAFYNYSLLNNPEIEQEEIKQESAAVKVCSYEMKTWRNCFTNFIDLIYKKPYFFIAVFIGALLIIEESTRRISKLVKEKNVKSNNESRRRFMAKLS